MILIDYINYINVVGKPMGPPHQNREKRDALLNYNLNSYTTTRKPSFSRGQTCSSYQFL